MEQILNEVQVFLDGAQKAGKHCRVIDVLPMVRTEDPQAQTVTLTWSVVLGLDTVDVQQVSTDVSPSYLGGATGDSQAGIMVSNVEG